MEAATDQGVGGRFPLTDERMTLEDFDSGGATEDRRKDWRMLGTWGSCEGRIQGKELGFRVGVAAFGDEDLADGGAVVEGVDGEEPGDLLAVFVDVFQEDSVGPDAEPGVDALGADGTLGGVQAAQGFLDALEAVLGLAGYGRAEV